MKDHLFLFYLSYFFFFLFFKISFSFTSALFDLLHIGVQHFITIWGANQPSASWCRACFLQLSVSVPQSRHNWVISVLWNAAAMVGSKCFWEKWCEVPGWSVSCQQTGLQCLSITVLKNGNAAKPHCSAAQPKKKWFSFTLGHGGEGK